MTAAPPLYLTGAFEPVTDEIDAFDLPVTGALPPELCGRYLRNGPNPLPGRDPGHWFVGHGMVHGIRLRRGRAEWYRNRWVRTAQLAGKPVVGLTGVDRTVSPGNTHVISHAGRLLALAENGMPHELSPELETLGLCDFDGKLRAAMTAHPKCDPVTGELHFFGYGVYPPYLTYHRLSAEGELVCSADIKIPGPSLLHDFAITERYAVFLDLPITFRLRLAVRGSTLPYMWDDRHGARLGLMRLDNPAVVRWFVIDPCFVFHVANAHEDASGRVVLDGARYSPADAMSMWATFGGTFPARHAAAAATAPGNARWHRWVIDPATGTIGDEPLDDRSVEVPTVDDERVGRHARYRYAMSGWNARGGIIKYDAELGTGIIHDLGEDTLGGESVFVGSRAPDRAEDEGWLLTIVTRRDGSASRLVVLDATDPSAAPVATVALPRGVPAGFHGSFIPDPDQETTYG